MRSSKNFTFENKNIIFYLDPYGLETKMIIHERCDETLHFVHRDQRMEGREPWMRFLGPFQERSAIGNWRKYLCLSHYATRSAGNSAARSGRRELSEEADGTA